MVTAFASVDLDLPTRHNFTGLTSKTAFGAATSIWICKASKLQKEAIFVSWFLFLLLTPALC